jgi:serine/threonine protein phosphatase 1
VYRGPQTILFGHWPAKQPRRAAHAIGLDTGCVYGNDLTAFIVETGEFISTPARQKYAGKPQQAG